MPEPSLLQRLKQRKIVQWALAYLAAAFVVFQLLDALETPLGLTATFQQAILAVVGIGFLVTLIMAWYHGEKGRQGVRPTEVLLLTVIGLAAGYGIWMVQGAGGSLPRDSLGLNPRSVAVLYFEDLSLGAELQHVSDGLTEGLIDALSRGTGLEVVSRNGSELFRGSSSPPDSIASALGAGTLIRGTVEPIGDQLRVSIRLVDGMSGVDFERRQFDLPTEQILLALDSLTSDAEWMIRGRIGEEVRARPDEDRTKNVDAWSFLQRGEVYQKRARNLARLGNLEGSRDAFEQADSFLALAEAADPEWVEPPTLRGWLDYRLSRLAFHPDTVHAGVDRGVEHVRRALEMRPNYPPALELRGTLRYWQWIQGGASGSTEGRALLAQAREDLEAAVEFDPGLAGAYSTLSHLYYQVSDPTQALLAAQRAYESDAYLENAPDILWRVFLASYDTELFSQSSAWCDEGRRRFSADPRFWECKLMEMTMPMVTPAIPEAWRIQERTVELTPENRKMYQRYRGLALMGQILARAGEPDSARSVLAEALLGRNVDDLTEFDVSFISARAYVLLGDYEEAATLLGIQGNQTGEWASYWWWRDLRNQPEFLERFR
jgi:TolB-like protein